MPGPIVGALVSSIFIIFGLLALFPPFKPLWKNLLPRLGGKPTEDTMKKGFWKMQLVGQSIPDSSGHITKVVAQLSVSLTLPSSLSLFKPHAHMKALERQQDCRS